MNWRLFLPSIGFALLGLLMLTGRGSILISGYNTKNRFLKGAIQ